ncbi:MerR family transcriptional regulator [Pseudarthrobacter sp. NPDC080039]|uniref:MerR family transcriptional regulator n=1 Tax=unclassified Pseudarthrobacter TaxID=2647000 RepID=UPI00344DCCD3
MMTIGAAAAAAHVTAKAVRLWEAKGLLPATGRTQAGYRSYSAADVEVLGFIRQAKALDLTLTEIKEILDLQRHGAVPCSRVTELLDAHIETLDRTLHDLSRLRQSLDKARISARDSQRSGEEAIICHIIEGAD